MELFSEQPEIPSNDWTREREKGPKKDGRQPHGLIFWFFYLHVFLVVFSSRESDGVMKKE